MEKNHFLNIWNLASNKFYKRESNIQLPELLLEAFLYDLKYHFIKNGLDCQEGIKILEAEFFYLLNNVHCNI